MTDAPRSAARFATRLILGGTLALAAVMLLAVVEDARALEQVPATEAQALAIERQLLCPVCTNERLDVCSSAICRDMKRIIRERLEAGSSPDDIILYFEQRYGPKVRARLERSGFNLWLYGWIGGSIVVVGALGGWFLVNLRSHARTASPGAAPPPEAVPDDDWLDAQIAESDDHQR